MTTVKNNVLGTVLNRIISGGGEVFAEDVIEVMSDLGLATLLYNKVSATLEQIVHDTSVADAFRNFPKWAWSHYYYGEYPGDMAVDALRSQHETAATQGINLILGLAALS